MTKITLVYQNVTLIHLINLKLIKKVDIIALCNVILANQNIQLQIMFVIKIVQLHIIMNIKMNVY